MDDTDDQDSFIQENEDDYQQCGSDFEDGQHSFNDEETKSRFTNYSLSSSVIRRSEGLVLLDDRFEKVICMNLMNRIVGVVVVKNTVCLAFQIFEEYDEDCIGALDGEDIDGFLKSGDPLFESVIENFKTKQMEDR